MIPFVYQMGSADSPLSRRAALLHRCVLSARRPPCSSSTRIRPVVISCRSPARPTSPTESCGRSTSRPSIIADRSSPGSTLEILDGMKEIFQTTGPVIIYPASGTGAWEAALVNTLSPGDRVLMFETGHFATLWRKLAQRLGLEVDFVPGDWRHGVDPARVEARLRDDHAHADQGGDGRAQRDLDRRDQPHPRSPRGDRPGRATRRCSWSTRSRRLARSTTGTTNGASTSPSPARRRA